MIMKMHHPSFSIGPIPVYGDLILAPMDGFCDWPFRTICRQFGSSMSYAPFINAIEIVQGLPRVLHGLRFLEEERPVLFQIYDHDGDRLLDAALRIQELHPDAIDVNMGCSVKRVSGRGAGAGLLRDPVKIGYIMDTLHQHLEVPITAKIRLGWNEHTRNYLDVAKSIQEHGGALVAVHARTRDQGYSGEVDWEAIAEIKQALTIPVIGNGDVRCVADIERMRKLTQCDAVMIGRAAVGNPWIFQQRPKETVSTSELAYVIHLHLERMVDAYGAEQGLILFRKHLTRYLRGYAISDSLRKDLLTCRHLTAFHSAMSEAGLKHTNL
jgi:tRNA-dihydrouridine synthase B